MDGPKVARVALDVILAQATSPSSRFKPKAKVNGKIVIDLMFSVIAIEVMRKFEQVM